MSWSIASCASGPAVPPCPAAGYETCQPKLLKILERLVFVKDITQDYTYYGIPSPWLQCKVLRLLQYFPPLESSAQEKQLHDIITAIVDSGWQADAAEYILWLAAGCDACMPIL